MAMLNQEPRAALDDPEFLEEILRSMGGKAYEAAVLDELQGIAKAEAEAVVGTALNIASHLGLPHISADAVKVACDMHMLMQPPVRERNLEAARIYNSRHVVWPVGGSAVRIPATAASLETLASTAGYAAVPLSDSAAGMPAEAKAKISVPLRLGPAEDRMLGAGAKVPLKKLPAPTGAAGSASSSSAGGAAKLPQQFINVED